MKKISIRISVFFVVLFAIVYFTNELASSRSFQFFTKPIGKVETPEKVVALTFDDGPGMNTNEILTILREEKVKGTFYLTGDEIERYYDDAVQIALDKHEIGNHSYSHQRMVFKSPSFIKAELEKTDELIRKIGYEGDIHFRPPFGKKLLVLPYYLSKQDRKTILWNIEPETYPEVAADSKKIVEHVIQNIEPGSIILLHVMYESRRESLDSVRHLITSLKREGYTFTTVSELLEYES